jgi:peptidoglycan/xylan/chitin deacetylase (PgdA/CDA1 family)
MTLVYYEHARRDQLNVALTFDDGPNPPRTDQVIEILNAKGARATFFVLGKWAERWPQALERIVRHGHVVGNHSYAHHAHLGDFDRAEAVIGNVIGRPTRFVRAHYFNFFTCASSPVAMSKDTKIVDADVNPADWNKTDPRAIVDATLNHPQLAGGSIIDLHDSGETDDDTLRLARPIPMIEALPAIIDGLQARGFQLVGLDEMEFVDPIEWKPDGRGLFASPEMAAIVGRR